MAETETARVVGIDLGTTNSLVAFMQGDQPQVRLLNATLKGSV